MDVVMQCLHQLFGRYPLSVGRHQMLYGIRSQWFVVNSSQMRHLSQMVDELDRLQSQRGANLHYPRHLYLFLRLMDFINQGSQLELLVLV